MYFPNLENKDHCWVQNPCRVTKRQPVFLPADYDKWIEITFNNQLRTKFEKVPLDVFWGSPFDEYPEIS